MERKVERETEGEGERGREIKGERERQGKREKGEKEEGEKERIFSDQRLVKFSKTLNRLVKRSILEKLLNNAGMVISQK